MKTQAAKCAKLIRMVLKQKFPHIKFSVTSQTYSMGNSVNVNYEHKTPREKIEKEIQHFEYGHFDGMNDYYEISNNINNLSQTKFLFVSNKLNI